MGTASELVTENTLPAPNLSQRGQAYLQSKRAQAMAKVNNISDSDANDIQELPEPVAPHKQPQYIYPKEMERLGLSTETYDPIGLKPWINAKMDTLVAQLLSHGTPTTVIYNLVDGVGSRDRAGSIVVSEGIQQNIPDSVANHDLGYVVARLHLLGSLYTVDFCILDSGEGREFRTQCRWPRVGAEIERIIMEWRPDDGYSEADYITHVIEAVRYLEDRADLLPGSVTGSLATLFEQDYGVPFTDHCRAHSENPESLYWDRVAFAYSHQRSAVVSLLCGKRRLHFKIVVDATSNTNPRRMVIENIHVDDPETFPLNGYVFGCVGNYIWRDSEAYFLSQLPQLIRDLEAFK
jgi:hypothetical protein